MNRCLTALVLALAACLSWFAPGHTQAIHPTTAEASRLPALVVLVDTLSAAEPRYRILHIPGDSVPHAVLLPRDADPELLTAAVVALQLIRQRAPQGAGAPSILRVRSETGAAPGRRVLPWAGRVLGDLRSTPPRDMAGLGRVRLIRIWLPAP